MHHALSFMLFLEMVHLCSKSTFAVSLCVSCFRLFIKNVYFFVTTSLYENRLYHLVVLRVNMSSQSNVRFDAPQPNCHGGFSRLATTIIMIY